MYFSPGNDPYSLEASSFSLSASKIPGNPENLLSNSINNFAADKRSLFDLKSEIVLSTYGQFLTPLVFFDVY